MKFPIRYADQVVGAFIILALGILVFVIFMLGSHQRWFSRDYNFITYFNSAAGLSTNMAVSYKGFTIGRVRSIRLDENDNVEVHFTIFDTYIDRVRRGSVVDIMVSPIGALGGSQFLFHPGLGTERLSEGDVIPAINSTEGRWLIAAGLAMQPEGDDNIANIMNGVGTLISTLNTLAADLQEAFEGTSRTTLGRTMGELEGTMTGIQLMASTLPDEIVGAVNDLMNQLGPVLVNVQELSGQLADPDGTVTAVLDSRGDVYTNLVLALEGFAGTLQNVETITGFFPSQLPQIAALLADLNSAVVVLEGVLIALTNNPLLRRGIPERTETNVGGTFTRDGIEF
jgi:phospholipid/cholesterol/gamma-HCH transport system substrate-binding protein